MRRTGGMHWVLQSREEGGVMGDGALRKRIAHAEAEKDFRGDAFHGEARQVLEPETAVVARMADEGAAFSALLAKLAQAFVDQGSANALALPWRGDGNGSKDEPAAFLAVDAGGGKCDMAQDGTLFFSYEGECEGVFLAEGFDDERLGLPAVRLVGEGGQEQLGDGGEIGGGLGAYDHDRGS